MGGSSRWDRPGERQAGHPGGGLRTTPALVGPACLCRMLPASHTGPAMQVGIFHERHCPCEPHTDRDRRMEVTVRHWTRPVNAKLHGHPPGHHPMLGSASLEAMVPADPERPGFHDQVARASFLKIETPRDVAHARAVIPALARIA